MGDGTIKRVTEEQIIAVLKEQELGAKAADLRYGPEASISFAKFQATRLRWR